MRICGSHSTAARGWPQGTPVAADPSARPAEKAAVDSAARRSSLHQNLVILDDAIAVSTELVHDFPKETFVLADREPAYVFEDEIVGLEINHEADEVIDQRVARVVESSFADHAESLTGGAAKNYVDRGIADPGNAADVCGIYVGHTAADGRAGREIELVDGTVNGIVLDGGSDVEASLLKSETHAACAGEEVHAEGSGFFSHCDSL